MNFFRKLVDLFFIPWYLLKEEYGAFELKHVGYVNFHRLAQKLTNRGMKVILHQRDEKNRVVSEMHIGIVDLPGQIYLVQKGDSNMIYVAVWGSSEFREKCAVSSVAEKLSKVSEIESFTGLGAVGINPFSLWIACSHYFNGLFPTLIGFRYTWRFFGDRHPATCAFYVTGQQ